MGLSRFAASALPSGQSQDKANRLGWHYALALSLAVAVGALLAQGEAHAQSAPDTAPAAATVQLISTVQVERRVTDADGKVTVTLADPKTVTVVPGDGLVFTLSYQNVGGEPATNFAATNPMPSAVQFIDVREDWADVSVDGGKTWGKLADLTIVQTVTAPVPEGDAAAPAAEPVVIVPAVVEASEVIRAATAADVTHVRWRFAEPIAPGAKGTLSFRGGVK